MKNVVILGYSGHALVTVDVLQSAGFRLRGYLDKEPSKSNLCNLEYLGYEQDNGILQKLVGYSFFPSIGDNNIRKKSVLFATSKNAQFITAISPSANVSKFINIDVATLVCPGACINSFAIIGKGVIINTGAIIEHECVISNFAHIAPGAVLAGNVFIGDGSFVGANAVIKQGITIGENAIIGAGSVVVKNIANNETWVGNPAKLLEQNGI
jgi:sugar O-acyltransferase (sialic acid O-acetyltransferase NeuD family)